MNRVDRTAETELDIVRVTRYGPIFARIDLPPLTAAQTSSMFSADVSACPRMPPTRGFDS